MQQHKHIININDTPLTKTTAYGGGTQGSVVQGTSDTYYSVNYQYNDGRRGTTTHGKQKGVIYLVKVL